MELNVQEQAAVYYDTYILQMNVLAEKLEVARATSKDPVQFDARYAQAVTSFIEATSCLSICDFIYYESLIRMVKRFIDSELLS